MDLGYSPVYNLTKELAFHQHATRFQFPNPSVVTVSSSSLFASASSVEVAAAAPGKTVAVELAVGVLDGELVVVGELLAAVDLPLREDDDVLLAIHADDPRVAVGLARVVDEARCVAVHCGVHHLEVVNPEHVTTYAL